VVLEEMKIPVVLDLFLLVVAELVVLHIIHPFQ
jgi:hypothetical protein